MRFFIRALLVSSLICVLSTVACAAGKRGEENVDTYDSFKRFSKVYELVRESYVNDVTPDELMEGAIKGLLQNLDPHSVFLNAEDFKSLQEATTGKFFGIGVEISLEKNQLTVVSPIEDTPAFKAGLKAGDVILAVDKQPTQDLGMQESVAKIRGEDGTEVELLIMSKNDKTPRTVKIKRGAIPLLSVKSGFLDNDGTAFIRLTRFSENSAKEIMDAVKALSAKAPITGLVFDLRNNPGGLLDESVRVASIFVNKGTVVSVRGRQKEDVQELNVVKSPVSITCPMVVLINSGSASASEIVAGAMQDLKRAVLVGEKSFGKGSVQKIISLGDDSAIKLTIARFFTPSGRSIQAEGITPDIEIPFEMPKKEADPLAGFEFFREKNLSKHLEANGEKQADKKKVDLVEKKTQTMLENDNQLRMGMQLVKGLPKIAEIHTQK